MFKVSSGFGKSGGFCDRQDYMEAIRSSSDETGGSSGSNPVGASAHRLWKSGRAHQ